MSRPVAATNEAVAWQLVRDYGGRVEDIAVALAREITSRGGWRANTCKPLHRAFELASEQAARHG